MIFFFLIFIFTTRRLTPFSQPVAWTAIDKPAFPSHIAAEPETKAVFAVTLWLCLRSLCSIGVRRGRYGAGRNFACLAGGRILGSVVGRGRRGELALGTGCTPTAGADKLLDGPTPF